MLALHFFKPGTLPNTARHSLQDLYHQRLIADDMGDLEQGAEDASRPHHRRSCLVQR